MTGMVQHMCSQLKSPVVVGIIMFLAVSGVVGYLSHTTLITPPLSKLQSSQPPAPTVYSRTETQQFLSPDGTKKLSFRIEPTSDPYLKTYFVVISDASKQYQVYSAEFGKSKFLLPPSENSWSPNTTYVFVTISAPDWLDPLVFKTDGSTFPNGNTYLDVDELLHKQTGYYVNRPIRWIYNTQLELSVVDEKDLKIQSFNYILNVVNQTFTKHMN